MAKYHPRNRAIAEEAVHPLDDFRRDLLKQGRERALDDKRQRAAVALAAWNTDRLGGGHLRIAIAHDLRPAADDGALDKSKATQGRATDHGHDIGTRALPPCQLSSAPRSRFTRFTHSLPMQSAGHGH